MAKKKTSRKPPQLLPPHRPPMTRETIPPHWYSFACFVVLLRSKGQAAEAIDKKRMYGYDLANKKFVRELIDLVKANDQTKWPKELGMAWEAASSCIFPTKVLIKKKLAQVIQSDPHPMRGYADVLAATKQASEIVGMTKSGHTFINQNNNQAAAQATVKELPRLFTPPWRQAILDAQKVTDVPMGTSESSAARLLNE